MATLKVKNSCENIEAEQFLATKDSFDNIMKFDDIKWTEGDMGSETFYISTINGLKTVHKGDYVVRLPNKIGYIICSKRFLFSLFDLKETH